MKTKIQIFIIFLIFLGLEAHGASVAPGIEKIITDLSVVSRLVNGIALQSQFHEKLDDVIAELLDAPSGDILKSLRILESNHVAKKLAEFQESLKKVPEPQNNVSITQGTLDFLKKALENSSEISKIEKNAPDPSIELETVMLGVPNKNRFNLEVFENSSTLLLEFQEKTVSQFTNQSLRAHLEATEKTISSAGVDVWMIYKSEGLEQFYKIISAPEYLKNVGEVAKIAKIFFSFTEQFLGAHETIKNLGEDLKALEYFQDLFLNFSSSQKISDDLEKSIQWLTNLTARRARKSLTSGLPRGISDLAEIQKDVGGALLPKLLSEGKSLKKLEKSLSSLKKFHVEMKKLPEKWKILNSTNATELQRFKEKWELLKFPNSSKILELQGELKTLEKCVKNITKPSGNFKKDEDFQKFKKLEDFVIYTSKRVKSFKDTMESLNQNNGTGIFFEKIQEMVVILKSTSLTDAEKFEGIKKFKDLNFAIKKFPDLVRRLSGYQETNKNIFMKTETEKIEFSVIPRMLKSLEGTGFLEALQCIYNESFQDFKNIQENIEIRKNIETMKSTEQYMNSTIKFLSETGEIQKLPIFSLFSRNSRNIPKPKIDEPLNLDISRGVEVLREYLKLLEHQKLIHNVSNAPLKIQKIAENATTSKKAWSPENQDSMKRLIPELWKFERMAQESRVPNNLTELWHFFEEAGKVQGPEIDGDLLRDPVSVALKNKGELEESGEFEELSELGLNFVQHHIYLRAAAISFRPLQEYFDEFFEIERHHYHPEQKGMVVEDNDKGEKGKGASLELSLGQIIAVIVLFVALGASCLGAYLLYYYLRKAYRWKNRERFWIYSQFFDWTESSQNIFLAIKEDRLETVKRRVVEEDCFINFYDNLGETPLHCAVTHLQPEMIDLLITNGADRNLRNLENLTAEQVLDRMPSTAQNADRMKEVVETFHKHKGKSYRPRVPDDFPRSRFSVELQCDAKLAEAFRKKYPDCLDSSNSKICTHVVVDTNEDGVYEIDGRGQKNEDPDRVAKFYVVLHPAILLKKSWAEACLKSKKNFQKDYEHRVTKVKFRGKTHETVDEWKKWMRWRAIPPLSRCNLFCASDIGSAPSRYLRGFTENMGATWLENPDAVLNQVGSIETPPPFWFPDKQTTWVVYSEGKKDDLETDFVNSKETLRTATIFSLTDFFEMLISMNGWTELEKKKKSLKLTGGREEIQQSSSNSSIASNVPTNASSLGSAPSSLNV